MKREFIYGPAVDEPVIRKKVSDLLCRKHIDVILSEAKNLNLLSARDSSLHFIPFRMTILTSFLQSMSDPLNFPLVFCLNFVKSVSLFTTEFSLLFELVGNVNKLVRFFFGGKITFVL